MVNDILLDLFGRVFMEVTWVENKFIKDLDLNKT